MIIFGILLVFIFSYIANYLIELDFLKESYSLPIPYDFVVISIVFLIMFFIYFVFQKISSSKVFNEINVLSEEIEKFNKEHLFEVKQTKTLAINKIFTMLNTTFEKLLEDIKNEQKAIELLQEDKEELKTILNLENALVAKINESGKVVLANKKLLKFLEYENETKLNMSLRSISEVFDEELEENWIIDNIDKEIEINIKGIKFLLHIEKIEKEMDYVITFININKFEKQKDEIKKRIQYAGNGVKTIFSINKTFEIIMIRIINYENYATHLGSGILEMFQDKFVNKIKNLGYDEVFKIQNDIFAIYDSNINFNEYKKLLEESLVLHVGDKNYMFNPKIVLGGGVNFEQAYQQILESSKTFVSKTKNSVKYESSLIKFVNEAVVNGKITLVFKTIENEANTILLLPMIDDEYDSIVSNKLIDEITKEFNLYITMLKELILQNLSKLKDYKLIINITSEELLSTTLLADLLSFIKREQLFVVFNVEINSNYSIILPILKQIKAFAQIGFRNVGNGYISFKDIYALKVDYLEIDDSIIKLIDTNPQWKFLLDSIKLLVSAQKTKLLSNNYNDEKVLRISENTKTL